MSEYYYVLEGHTPRREEPLVWVRWLADHIQDCIVHQDRVGDIMVSTVFTGVDDGLDTGSPTLFQTNVFMPYPDRTKHYGRYVTWEEAEAGHAVAVDLVQQAVAEAWVKLRSMRE